MGLNIGKEIKKAFKNVGKEISKNVGKPIVQIGKKMGKGITSLKKPIVKIGKDMGKGITSLKKPLTSIGKAIFGGLKKIPRVFIFIWKIFIWLGVWVMCSFNKILKLPQCFLWYFLELVGFVVYLPFRILFAIIDYALMPGFNKMVYNFWCFLYSVDAAVYASSGFHFMHYPDEILDNCYRCKSGKFPKF